MKSSVTQLVELAPALAAVLGADAVHTEATQLDAYAADMYWPAIAAQASGTPLGRPDVVVVPRSPVVGEALDGVCCEGEPDAVSVEGSRTVELARLEGARELDPALAQRWWDRRYEFYRPPHHPPLPAMLLSTPLGIMNPGKLGL